MTNSQRIEKAVHIDRVEQILAIMESEAGRYQSLGHTGAAVEMEADVLAVKAALAALRAESPAPELPTLAAPDNAIPGDVLRYVRACAATWEGGARLLGNARAADIVRAIDAMLDDSASKRVAESPAAGPGLVADAVLEVLKGRLPFYGRDDHDDYVYLARLGDLVGAANAIVALGTPAAPPASRDAR